MRDYEAGARALCEFYGENPDKVWDDSLTSRFFYWVRGKKPEKLWETYAAEMKRQDERVDARRAAYEAMDV